MFSRKRKMPKKVDEIHDALIADPNFYPEKSDKQKESIAWAIAWSKFKKKSKKRKKKSMDDLNKVIIALEDYGMQKEANELHNIFVKVAQAQDYPKIFKFIKDAPNIIIFAEDPGPYYVYQDGQRTNFSSGTVEEAVDMAKENFPDQEIAFVYMLEVENRLKENRKYGLQTKPAYFYYNGQKMSFPAVDECREASQNHAADLKQNLNIRVVPMRSGYFIQEQDRITRSVDVADEYPRRRRY